MTKEENEMNLFKDHLFAAKNSAFAAISGIICLIVQHSLFLQLVGIFFFLSNSIITIRMLRSNKIFGRHATNTFVQALAMHSSFTLLFVPLFLLKRKK